MARAKRTAAVEPARRLGLHAREWEALSAADRARRARERPAYHRPFAPPSPDGLWRPAMEVTDARGLTLHPATIPRDEMPAVIRWLVDTYL